MAQAKHIGKVVITLDEKEFVVAPPSAAGSRSNPTRRTSNGWTWRSRSGPRPMDGSEGCAHLVLVGRSGATSAAAHEALAAMQERGASWWLPGRTSPTHRKSLRDQRHRRDDAALRGVIHLALSWTMGSCFK